MRGGGASQAPGNETENPEGPNQDENKPNEDDKPNTGDETGEDNKDDNTGSGDNNEGDDPIEGNESHNFTMTTIFRDSSTSTWQANSNTDNSYDSFNVGWYNGSSQEAWGTISGRITSNHSKGTQNANVDRGKAFNSACYLNYWYAPSSGGNRHAEFTISSPSGYQVVGMSTLETWDNTNHLTAISGRRYFNGTSYGTCSTGGGANSSGNMRGTLYLYARKKYTMTYNANGGSGSTPSSTQLAGVSFTLPTTSSTKSGYIFNGWRKGSTSGELYKAYRVITADELKENITWYADWVKPVVTLYSREGYFDVTDAFAENSSNWASQEIEYSNGAQYGRLPFVYRVGYCFAGWYTGVNGSGTKISPLDPGESSTAIVNGHISLYPYFIIQPTTVRAVAGWYDVTIQNYNGWLVENEYVATKILNHNDTYGTLPTFNNLTGYTFKRWSSDINDTVEITSNSVLKYTGISYLQSDGSLPTREIIIYGQFTPNQYDVNINVMSPEGEETYADGRAGSFTVYYSDDGSRHTGCIDQPKSAVDYKSYFEISDIVPGTGMYLEKVTVDGEEISGSTIGGYHYYKIYLNKAQDISVNLQMRYNSYRLDIYPNGGTFNGSSSTTSVTREYGSQYNVANPTRQGYTFTGWQVTGYASLNNLKSQTYVSSSGASELGVYNNNNNGAVTHTIVSDSSTSTRYSLKITTNGSASPGAGGFINYCMSKANGVFIHSFVAKIPVGYYVQDQRNSIGNGGYSEWLTPQAGTGNWETYAYEVHCGSSGNFSSFGHVNLYGPDETNVTWWLREAMVYDMTGDSVFTFGAGQGNLVAQWTKSKYQITAYGDGGEIGNATGWSISSDKASATYDVYYSDTVSNFPRSVNKQSYALDYWKINYATASEWINDHAINVNTGEAFSGVDYFCTKAYIPISGSEVFRTNYTVSGIYAYDANYNYIKRCSSYATVHTMPSNARYMKIEVYARDLSFDNVSALTCFADSSSKNISASGTLSYNYAGNLKIYPVFRAVSGSSDIRYMAKKSGHSFYSQVAVDDSVCKVVSASYFVDESGSPTLKTDTNVTGLTRVSNALIHHQITLTLNDSGEYLFKGVSTNSNAVPSEPNLSVVIGNADFSYKSYIYVYFEEVTGNQLKYDKDEGFFYFEDGEFPQSSVDAPLKLDVSSSNPEITAICDKNNVMTLNGTTSDEFMLQAIPMSFIYGQKFSLSLELISGNWSGGSNWTFVLEISTDSSSLYGGGLSSNRNDCGTREGNAFFIVDSAGANQGKFLTFWIWFGESITFNNAKFKVVINSEMNELLDNNVSESDKLYDLSYNTSSGDENVPVYEFMGQKYAKVAHLNWFKVEPIKWRVSELGVGPEDYPSGWEIRGSKKNNFNVVSHNVLSIGAISNQKIKEGWDSTDSELSQQLLELNRVNEFRESFKYDAEQNALFDRYANKANQTVVESLNVKSSGLRIASMAEIEENFADKSASATDFAAALLGVNGGDKVNYWTRDLGTRLGQGKIVTSFGRESTKYLKNTYGVRFAYTMDEGINTNGFVNLISNTDRNTSGINLNYMTINYDANTKVYTLKIINTSTADDPYATISGQTAYLEAGKTYEMHMNARRASGQAADHVKVYYGIDMGYSDNFSCEFVGEQTVKFVVPTTGTYDLRLDNEDETLFNYGDQVFVSNFWIKEATGLPSGYTEIEYIQTNGNQWIDTGYFPCAKTRVVADYQFDQVTQQARVFGVGGAGLAMQVYISGGEVFSWAFKDGDGDWSWSNVSADTKRHVFDLDGVARTFKIDGGKAYNYNLTTQISARSNVSLTIFGDNSSAGVNNFTLTKAKLYAMQIFENSVIVRDFVPCINPNGVAGLYDRVEGKFYTSVGGGASRGRQMRYIKVTMDGSNKNVVNHLQYLKVNTAGGGTITVVDAANAIGENKVVAGRIFSDGGTVGNGNTVTDYYEAQEDVTIFDIGMTVQANNVYMRRYYEDARYYYGTKLEGSIDGVNWFNIYNSYNEGSYGNNITWNTYVETEAGRTFNISNELLDMDDFMNFFNYQEGIYDNGGVPVVKNADGSYSWEGASGGHSVDGAHQLYTYKMNLKNGNYRLSFNATTDVTDPERPTTGLRIFNKAGATVHASYVTCDQSYYEMNFAVDETSFDGLGITWNYGDRTTFKNIHLEYVGPISDSLDNYIVQEFIESTGTQYIDTGFAPNQDTSVEMGLAKTEASGYWFGAWNVGYNDGAYAFCNDAFVSVGGVYVGYGNQGGTSGNYVTNGSHVVKQDKNKSYVDGEVVRTYTYNTFQLNYNLYLFAQNRKGECYIPESDNSIACTYCKIWDNGTLIRDFVPVQEKATGVQGLFDKVSNAFYPLKFAGGVTDFERNYTRLSYIESSGTQYIDTGINNFDTMEVDCKLYATTVANHYLFGDKQNSETFIYNGLYSNHLVEYNYKDFEYEPSNMVEMKQRISGDTMTINVNGQTFSTEVGKANGERVYVGASNQDGERVYPGLKIYYFKIYNKGVMIRDFVPVRRNSDGEIGLYDRISEQFFGNAGTGSFVGG